MSELLTAREVLNLLKIKDRHVVGYLVARGLLPRIPLGPRSFRYEKEDCERLLERVKNEGLILTAKP